MSTSLHEPIETIESGYEFLMAYAAQGRADDSTSDGSASEVRQTLTSMAEATSSILQACEGQQEPFMAVVANDAANTSAALSLVLKQDKLSSELIDNLNVSTHLRALLTDLFLLSETISK